ncbi:jasmonoyl--L-amino acid synthetase JAR6-like [Salvia hispanica]|uniref:jasmonoyl--L-amino acid synthetase JAR6-like n=1 Tax=Salvia hispanica TaxID=49212 RepID=UPI002008FD5F|nr:jasmonoyl--L-amino acid synthetase JAR6-like [Salvia hispanica]XP_047943210.1 jasmonoyl--L-amino acid synthetase JAR6-like [Salvia hispanica]
MLEKMQERVEVEEVVEEFELLTKDAGRVQRETLKKILEQNGATEYLSQWGLNGRTDPDTYKACVPVVTHADIEPYIRRIADAGILHNSSIITAKPIPAMSLSSGTTQGKPKYLPFNDDLVENTVQVYKTSFAFRNREYPIDNGKALQFIYSSKQFTTKGGLRAGTATTHLFSSPDFKQTLRATQRPCCSPDEVIFGGNYHHSLYCHLLCGLLYRDHIQLISSTFAHSIVHAFRTFEHIWPHLVADIRRGSLSSRITSAPIQSAMAKLLLKPDPNLADAIHQKCLTLSNWYGLIPALFPNAKYIYGIMTGSMEPYINKLRHYAGEIPLVSADYGASEGWIGVNVNPKSPPEEATFAVVPNVGYFEFIPLDSGGEAVGLTEVEIGKEYEVVTTSFAGLYRYKLGDVVRVEGFRNGTPEVRFVCRRNVVLSINLDKNTERDLQVSVEAAAKVAAAEKVEVVDYTSCVEASAEPARYVVFWEMSGGASDEVVEECCNCLDRSFVDAGYVSMRRINGIGALELRILKRGTFQKVMDHFVGMGGAVSQFKTPRCVGPANGKLMQILAANVVKTCFSTAY